jgi:PDZ domain-containing secreted protein
LEPREVKAEVYLKNVFSLFNENLNTVGEAKGNELNFEKFINISNQKATEFAKSLEATEEKKERVNDVELSIVLHNEEEKKVKEKVLSLKVSSDEKIGIEMLLSRPFANSADVSLKAFGNQCWIAPGLVRR